MAIDEGYVTDRLKEVRDRLLEDFEFAAPSAIVDLAEIVRDMIVEFVHQLGET